MKSVMLPGSHARRAYALWAVAGLGIAVGGIGLFVGMRSHGSDTEKTAAMTPPPAPLPATAAPVPREVQKIAVQLEADVANAHVVFRRRVETPPATLQISATDVVELVEISAPGYKTERYWLTFDRPTHLHAHLVKGTGMAEATEEETLVALGEVSAPTTPAVAAAAPQAAAIATKTVERTPPPLAAAQARMPEPTKLATLAPRKIGRAAADSPERRPVEQPQMMAPDLPVVTEEPVAKTEPKPEAAKTEPKPEPVAKPEPTLPEPTRPEAAAQPEMPAVVATPAIDNATVSSVVGTHRPEVLKCFAEGKKKDHAMKGTISLQLQVDTGGKVHRVQVQSTLKDPLVAACVVKSGERVAIPGALGCDRAGDGHLSVHDQLNRYTRVTKHVESAGALPRPRRPDRRRV